MGSQEVALIALQSELTELAHYLKAQCPYTKLGMGTGYASAKNVHVQNKALDKLKDCFVETSHFQWWVNIMHQGDFTDWHTHSPGTHAAVYYVTAGEIDFDLGTVRCRPGTLLRFEADMRHRVLPVQMDCERITYAFNYSA